MERRTPWPAALVLAAACSARAPAPSPVLDAFGAETPSVAGEPDRTASKPEFLPPVEFQDEVTRDRIARMEGYFPDPLLTTHHDGQTRFYRDLVRGKCVLIQFMYTSCEGT